MGKIRTKPASKEYMTNYDKINWNDYTREVDNENVSSEDNNNDANVMYNKRTYPLGND